MKEPSNNATLHMFDKVLADGNSSPLTIQAMLGYADSKYHHDLDSCLQKLLTAFNGCSFKYDNSKSSVYEYGTELSKKKCLDKDQHPLLEHLKRVGASTFHFPSSSRDDADGYSTCTDYISWVTSTVQSMVQGFDAVKAFVSEMDLRARITGESLKSVTGDSSEEEDAADNDGLLNTTIKVIEELIKASKLSDLADTDSKALFRLTKLTDCKVGTESFSDNLNIVVNSLGYTIRVLDSIQNHNTLVSTVVQKFISPNMSAYGKYEGYVSTTGGRRPHRTAGGATMFNTKSTLDTTTTRMSDLDKTTHILRNTVDTVVTKLHTNLYRLADSMFTFGYSEIGSKTVPLNANIIALREHLERLVVPETHVYEGLLSLLGVTKGTSEATQSLVFALQQVESLLGNLPGAKTQSLKEIGSVLSETISFIRAQKNKISDSDVSELAKMYSDVDSSSATAGCYREDRVWSDGLLLKMADNIQRFNNSLKTLSYCIYTKTLSSNAQMYNKILTKTDTDYQTLLAEAISSQKRKTLMGYQRLRGDISSCVGSLRVYKYTDDKTDDTTKYQYLYVDPVNGEVRSKIGDDDDRFKQNSIVISFKGRPFESTIRYKLNSFRSAANPGGGTQPLPVYADLEGAQDLLKKHLYSISTYISCVESSVSSFYDTVVSLDMYLKDFTDGLESNMEALREMESVLTGLEYNDNWYTEDSGNMLCQVFDKMSVQGSTKEDPQVSSPQGESNKTVKTTFLDFYPNQHYYELFRHDSNRDPNAVLERLHLSEPLSAKEEAELVTAPLFPGSATMHGSYQPGYIEYIKQKLLSRFISNWRPLNNLFNAFASIGSRFGDSGNIQGKNFMKIKDLYQNICAFMVESAFVINDSNMRIEFAMVDASSGGGRRPTNMLSDELKLLPLMLKAVCAKVLTTLSIHKKLVSRQDSMLIDSARVILGGAAPAGEDGALSPDAAPQEGAIHLYYLLPLLIRWYALLFSDKDDVSITITSVISYLPNQIGLWSDLIKTVFLATSRSGYTPPIYSSQETASIVQSINKIYKSYAEKKPSSSQKKQQGGEDIEVTRTIVTDLIREVTQRFGVVNKKDVSDFYAAEEQSALRLLQRSGASLESLSATLAPPTTHDPSVSSMSSRQTKRYLRPIDDDQPRPTGKNPLDRVGRQSSSSAAADSSMFNMEHVLDAIQSSPKAIVATAEETGLDRNSYELVKSFRTKLALLFKVGHKNYKSGIVESNILSHARDMFSKAKTSVEKMDAADYIINIVSKYDAGGVSSSDLSDVLFKETVVTNLRALYSMYKFLSMLANVEKLLKSDNEQQISDNKAGLILLLTSMNESELFDVTISNGISPISISFAKLSKTVSDVFAETVSNFQKIYPTIPNKEEYTRYVDENFKGSLYFLEKNFYNVWFKQESKTTKPLMFSTVNAQLNAVFARLFRGGDKTLLGMVVPLASVSMKRESTTANLTGVVPGMYNNFEGVHGDPIPLDIYKRFAPGSTDPAEPFGAYDISGSSVPTSRDIITEFNDILHKIIVNSVDNKQTPKLYSGIHDAISRVVVMSDAISDPDSKTIPDIPGMNLYRNMFYEIQPAGGDRYTMFSPLGIVDNGRLVLFDSLETLPIIDGGADAPGKSTGKDYVTRTDLQIQYGLPKVGVVLFRSVVNLFNNLKYASVRNRTTRYSPRDATQSLLVENLSDVPVNLKYKLRTYIPLYSKMLGALVTKCDTLLSMLNLNTIEVDSYKGIPNLPAGTNDIRQYVNILKRGVNGNLVPVSATLVTEILLSSLDSSQGITVPTDEDGLAQMQNVFHSERDAPPAGEYLRDVCNSVRDSASTLQKNLADVEKELASAEKPRFLELGNGFLDNQMRLYKAVPFAPPSILSRWMNVFKLCTLNGKSYVSDTSLFPVHNPSSANYKLLYTISRIIASRNPSVPDMEFPYMEKAVSEFNQKNGTDMKLGRSWFTLFRFFVDSVAYQANYSTSDLFSTQMEQVERASDSSSVGYFTYGGSALKIMMEPSPEAVMRYLDPSLAPKGKSSGGQDAYYGESASAAPGGVSDVNKSILLLQKMLATLPPDILEEIKSDQHHDLLAYSILYAVYAKQKAATVELLRNFSSGSVISKVRATLAAMAGAAATTAVEAGKTAGFSTHPDYGAVHPATECLFALQTLIFLERLSYFYDKAMAYFKSKITESDYSTIVGMVGQYCAPIVFKESKASMSSLDQTVLDFFSSRAPILGSFMISNGNSVVPLQEVMFILLDKYKVLPFGLQTTDILNFPANSADSSTLEMYNQHARRVLEAVRTTDAKLLNVPDGEFSTRISREETRLNVTANQDAFNTNERIEILKCAFSSDLTCDVYGFLTEYLDRGAPQPDGMALSDFELAETKIRAERMDNVASVSKVLSDISYLDRQDINLFNPTEVATIHRVFTHYNIMPINVHALRSSIPLANIYNYAVTFDDMIKVHLGIKHPKDSSKLVMSEDRVLWEWYEHMQNPYRSLTDSSSSGSNGSADKSKVIVALALATMPALNSMRTGAAQTSASLLELLVPGVAAHKRTENVIKGQTSLGVSFMYQDGGHLAMPTNEYKDKIGQVIGRCDMDALYSLVSSADSISAGFKLPKSLISRLTGVPYSQNAGPRIAGAPDNGPVLFGAGVWYNQGNEPGNPFERPINDVYSNKLHRIYTYMFNAVSATSEFASAAHAAYKLLGKFVEARVRSTILQDDLRQTGASIPTSKSIVFSSQEEAFTTTLVFDPEAAGAAPVTLDNLMTVSKTNIPNNFEQEFKTWITNNAQDNQEDSAKLPADQNTRDRAIMVGTMLVHFMKDAEDLTDDTVYEALKSIQKLCYLCDVAARNSQNYKENYETDVTQFYAAYSSLDFANIKTDKPTPTKYVKPPDVTKDNVLLGPSEQINSRLLAFLIDQEAKDRPGTDYFSTVNEMWSLNNPSKIRTLISVLSDSGVQSAIVDSGSINLFIQSQIKPRLGLNRPRFLFDDVFNKVIFTLNSTSSDLSYGSSQRALEYLDQSNQRKFVINVDEDKKKELDVINNFRLNTVLLRCSIFTTNLFRALVTIMDKTMYVNTAMVKRGAAATQLSMVEQPGHREYH